jgi:hypothetical protein
MYRRPNDGLLLSSDALLCETAVIAEFLSGGVNK